MEPRPEWDDINYYIRAAAIFDEPSNLTRSNARLADYVLDCRFI